MQLWILAFGLLIGWVGMQRDLNWVMSRQAQKVSLAASEVDDYRLFLFAANQYMANFNGGAGELTWADLSNSDAMPAALRAHVYSSLWRVVVLPDGSWVVCSPMGERALGMQSQFMSAHGLTWLPIDPSLKNQATGAQLRYMDHSSESQGLCG